MAQAFAHVHNVRLTWLKAAAPELLIGLEKIERAEVLERERLARSLEESGNAVGTLLGQALEADGRVKGFKPHAAAFLGYLISHESHHRGQIVLSLKQAGYPVDRKTLFGLWEWGVR